MEKEIKESDNYGQYILDDGVYYIPNGREALSSGFFITETGYLYKVSGITKNVQPTMLEFELDKKVESAEVEKVMRETGAVLAKKV